MSFSHSACGPSSPDACAAGNEDAQDADISSLLGMLASVTDPRSPQGIQHILEFVLAVCVVAMLAGAKNYREIAGHAADLPQPLLGKLGAEWSWFRLRYKYPSESTIRNVLTRVDAAELAGISGVAFLAGAGTRESPVGDLAREEGIARRMGRDESEGLAVFRDIFPREANRGAEVGARGDTRENTGGGPPLDAVNLGGGVSPGVALGPAHPEGDPGGHRGGAREGIFW